MKITLSNILIALLCAALICAALLVGAVRGWNGEREEALSALTEKGEMRTQLEERGMDAANLSVVAARHLASDNADLLALQAASRTLLSDTQDIQAILQADATITSVALRFSTELPLLPSVQHSSRDQTYISMLTASLGKKSSLTNGYTQLVEDYNHRLSSSIMGRLAMLLGVDPLPVPDAE